jgi:magnesium transporter
VTRRSRRPSPDTLDQLVLAYFSAHPEDVVHATEDVPPSDLAAILARLQPAQASEVLRRHNPDDAAAIVATMSLEAARRVLEAMDPARTAGLLARMNEVDRPRLLSVLPKNLSREVQTILEFPAGTAGALMDANVTAFREDVSVQNAIKHLRVYRARRIADVMVVDDDFHLVGVVSLQDLVSSEPEQRLGSLCHRKFISVHPVETRDQVVELLNKYKILSLPVVDLERRLIGILRYDALVRAAQQDAAGDMAQMVGASREERALSSPWTAVRSRLMWLNVNLVTAFLASAVVGLFEDTIAKLTAIAVLLPIVAGQSGNTGAQAMAVTMRGLALREIRAAQWLRVLRKEAAVGLVNGVAISLLTAGAVLVWSKSLPLAGVMAMAMILSMGVASVAGAAVPVVLVSLKRDPATASSIILTTITDVVGFFLFLGLATLLSDLLVG